MTIEGFIEFLAGHSPAATITVTAVIITTVIVVFIFDHTRNS